MYAVHMYLTTLSRMFTVIDWSAEMEDQYMRERDEIGWTDAPDVPDSSLLSRVLSGETVLNTHFTNPHALSADQLERAHGHIIELMRMIVSAQNEIDALDAARIRWLSATGLGHFEILALFEQ